MLRFTTSKKLLQPEPHVVNFFGAAIGAMTISIATMSVTTVGTITINTATIRRVTMSIMKPSGSDIILGSNIIRGWKGLPGTNTLAYYPNSYKKFYKIGP